MSDSNGSERAESGGISASFRRISLFSYAVLFALIGQWLAAGAMSLANAGGLVDFSTADPSETAPFNVLAGVFVLQILFILIGFGRSGFTLSRLFRAVAALLWALAWLMIFYVALACDLYGACL